MTVAALLTRSATPAHAHPPGLARRRGDSRTDFRRDIQGLRAIAVAMVALGHAGVPQMGGGFVGVDVFFVISGFVITTSLLGHGERPSLAEFYAARARRILPMATMVLAVTVVASWRLLNVVQSPRVITDAVWGGLFAANVHFGATGTDYFAADQPPSPLQHYWSLAVEEQFYLVWPMLILAVFTASRSRRLRHLRLAAPGAMLVGLLVVISTASLLWSAHETASSPTAAYFSTSARAWELAVGALLAVIAGTVARLPAALRVPLGWLGLAGIATAVVVFSVRTPFPGLAVALPVLSTAAVLMAGSGRSRLGPTALLGLRPLQALGDRSFSFYLWHWPLLVIAAAYAEQDLALAINLVLLVLAFLLSVLSFRVVETPFRRSTAFRSNRQNSLLLWPAALVVVLLVCTFVGTQLRSGADLRAASAESEARVSLTPGALPAVPTSSPEAEVRAAVAAADAHKPVPTALSPSVDRVPKDFDYSMCYAWKGETSGRVCRYGDTSATRSLAIIGDSHAMMWFPTLNLIGKKYGWVIYPFFKPTCVSADVTMFLTGQGPYTECDRWRRWALKTAASMRFDRVIISDQMAAHLADSSGHEISDFGTSVQRWLDGVKATAGGLRTSHTKVTVLGDAPGLEQPAADCLLRRSATMTTCTFKINPTWSRRNQATAEGAKEAGAAFVDITGWFCSSGRCPTVIGNRIAYQDSSHVSRTYALRLAEPLAARIGLR